MSHDAQDKLTGIAWAPSFAVFDAGSSVSVVNRQPALPRSDWLFEQHAQWRREILNYFWDLGLRVQCLRDILYQSGLADLVSWVDFESESLSAIQSFHSVDYIESVPALAQEAGALAVGAVTQLVRHVFERKLSNGYALVRPAGHHADREHAGGGCIFANGVFAAREARHCGAQRVLYVDWDAHHGNGQQGAFWKDRCVLTISIHQARNAPPLTSGLDARGEEDGVGFNINIPVSAGSGTTIYKRAFQDVIEVAAEKFRPDFVIVSSGLDGNHIDPSSRLSLHSQDYYWMASKMVEIAKQYAGGRIVMTHEGGYATAYIPICFLRIVEAMSGLSANVDDPFLFRWGSDFAGEVHRDSEESIRAAAVLANLIPQH